MAQDTLNETSKSPVLAFEVSKARGCTQIDRAIGSRRVSVAVGEDDAFLYDRAASRPRTPASNEKLLLSMTLYDTFGADFRITTSVAASGGTSGAVRNLWILGQGDPGVTGPRRSARSRGRWPTRGSSGCAVACSGAPGTSDATGTRPAGTTWRATT